MPTKNLRLALAQSLTRHKADSTKMAKKIAEIAVDPQTREIVRMSFSKTSLKFRCQRCAVFCCKCGSPRLLPRDVRNVDSSGKHASQSVSADEWALPNRSDGSCVFLSVDSGRTFTCKIYNSRPTLCRAYPFQFERIGENSFSMNLIPCCNGLNTPDGQPVDERFFRKHLKKPFLDLLEQY